VRYDLQNEDAAETELGRTMSSSALRQLSLLQPARARKPRAEDAVMHARRFATVFIARQSSGCVAVSLS
jgi:hypothetical protein